jgi:hypothetical protein
MYYIGLDVHKRTISYCVKDSSGAIHAQGTIPATRMDLDRWMKTLPQPWSAAMEATMFTGWIYDHLKPHAAVLKVAHPLMLRAIAAAKKQMTASTPTRFAIVCVAIFCRSANAERQSRQRRDRQIHSRRSPEVNFGRFPADLWSTPI